jgi:FG-GAP-like repeat
VAHSAVVRLAVVVALVCAPGALLASNVSFSKHFSPGVATTEHADLNNDGCDDLVYQNGGGGFDVQLSRCDGTYAAAVSYTIPGGADTFALAIEDVNGAGRADVAAFGSDDAVHVFLNSGSGTFSPGAVFSHAGISDAFTTAVGDFNHDGWMDVAYQSGLNVNVLFGNGKGSFTAGPSRGVSVAGYLMLGDFDGDGRADLAVGDLTNYDTVEVLYGDNTGHFPTTLLIQVTGGHYLFNAADVNSDGKMDILGSQFYPSAHSIAVYYGNSARGFIHTTIPLAHCAAFGATAADLNGDGINDLVVNEADCNNNSQTGNAYIGVLTRNSNSSYNLDQILQTTTSYIDNVSVIRADRNTKPDISFLNCKQRPCSVAENLEIGTLLNTTAGSFPACAAPNGFEGIRMCSPAGATVSSPMAFHVGASGQVVMRKVEVWVDGRKVAEQLGGFSNQSFLDRSLSLAAGTHHVDIYAAGWDNWLERKSFTLAVH